MNKIMNSLSSLRESMTLPYFNGHTIMSKKVPTEYDVVSVRDRGKGLWTLSDDRSRHFHGLTLQMAWLIAEFFQDKRDPIHHEPYGDPAESNAPKTLRERIRRQFVSTLSK